MMYGDNLINMSQTIVPYAIKRWEVQLILDYFVTFAKTGFIQDVIF